MKIKTKERKVIPDEKNSKDKSSLKETYAINRFIASLSTLQELHQHFLLLLSIGNRNNFNFKKIPREEKLIMVGLWLSLNVLSFKLV